LQATQRVHFFQVFYPAHAKVIQVDLRGEQIGRRTAVDLGLYGSVQDTLQALLPLLQTKRTALISNKRKMIIRKHGEGSMIWQVA
jgi:pyruvate dehydrogenase (quinone)